MHRRAQVQRVSERAESVTSWSASALDHYTDKPNIILCDNAFNKKAVTALKGADPQKDKDKK